MKIEVTHSKHCLCTKPVRELCENNTAAENYAKDELDYALEQYPAFNSPHEAYGVLAEEFKEVMDALHANDFIGLYKELGQVSAVAMKAMMMIDDKGLNNVKATKLDTSKIYNLGGPCADHRHTDDPAHHVCPNYY